MEEAGMRLAKEKKMKSCYNDDRSLPYRVSYPGQYPYELRPSKDPRLGFAQKRKEKIYKEHGLKDDDDDDVDVASSEDGTEDYYPNPPLPVVQIPFNGWRLSPSIVSYMSQPVLYMSYPEWTIKSNQNWKKELKRDVKNEAKYLKKIDCDSAEAAIKFYNQKHGTDYKIVETLGSYECYDTGFWFHCNFRAQCKSPSPPKLFFAELNSLEYDQLIVKVCMPLDDGLGNRFRIVRGCEMCGNQLFHPVNGFEAGRKFVRSSAPLRAFC